MYNLKIYFYQGDDGKEQKYGKSAILSFECKPDDDILHKIRKASRNAADKEYKRYQKFNTLSEWWRRL